MLTAAERKSRAARRRLRRRPAMPVAWPGASLVVATYNVHTCVGIDRRYDPARIAAVLRELDADIVSLQEVAARPHGPAPLDQESYLAAETGTHAVAGPRLTGQRGRFGNAILTRLPVLAIRHIDLSIAGCEPRGALDVDLDFGGRVLRVVATHFGLRGGERRLQTRMLLAALAGNGGAGGDDVLMMGDLNEWRGRRGGIPALDRELGRSPAPRTFPSWCPILALDRIYAAPPARMLEFGVHRSPLSRLASDHLPLRARLGWAVP